MTLFGSGSLAGLLMQSIKRDLVLTDTQVSLVVGFAAAAFNAIASLPISRLVDTISRRLILGIGLLTMGVGSALTGLANGFWQLFAARLFAGIGGAGNGPATYSILADYFPPAKLPKAIAFMNFGFTSGTGLALVLGGTLIAALATMDDPTLPIIGAVRPWQLVFLVMAIPDLVLGLLMLTTVYEPPRRGRVMAADGQKRTSRGAGPHRPRVSLAQPRRLRADVPRARLQLARNGHDRVGMHRFTSEPTAGVRHSTASSRASCSCSSHRSVSPSAAGWPSAGRARDATTRTCESSCSPRWRTCRLRSRSR